jgi:hypothetical protein
MNHRAGVAFAIGVVFAVLTAPWGASAQSSQAAVESSFPCPVGTDGQWCRPPLYFSRDFGDELRARIGLEVAPVTLDLQGKNENFVGLGSYLVNAQGGCGGCHTHPAYANGGNPYLGQPSAVNVAQYLSGGRQFGPKVVSSNLTPDASGKPAGLTFAQFKSVLTTGKDPDGSGRILQVMPWPEYAALTDLDLRAIYEYLRAIPSLPNNPNPGP